MNRAGEITLVVKNGKQFQPDLNILSQASPFFEKLLSNDMKERNEGVIRLQTITDSQMAEVLQFIYSSSVQITSKENAEKLIETADFLLLSNLKTIAGKFLEQHITTETCISMNYLAEQYSVEELVASTRKFINSNFTTVASSKAFLNLPSSEVEKWISSDEIVIDAEENVLEIILKWIDHNKSERSGKFSELFGHVRLTCVSRDYLLSHVVTNDLVKENADCLDSVTGALEWLHRPTDCDVPRPHSPRKALTLHVIVIADCRGGLQPCIYLPATDGWYLLPATKSQRLNAMEHIVSCRGKVFFITNDFARSQCYDPDLNCWSPAPWTADHLPFSAGTPLVAEDRIYFVVEETSSTSLWTYSLDSNWLTPLHNWVERTQFCAVTEDNYIYVIGGGVKNTGESVSECARFDTEENKWQKIAPLNEARQNAFGVCKSEKVFIAGGLQMGEGELEYLYTSEVYNKLTDEWQFIAGKTLRRAFGSMVLIDETVYVLGVDEKQLCSCLACIMKYRAKVECYNPATDEWNVKTTVPVNKMISEKTDELPYVFQACPLRIFKGVLTNLESIAESD